MVTWFKNIVGHFSVVVVRRRPSSVVVVRRRRPSSSSVVVVRRPSSSVVVVRRRPSIEPLLSIVTAEWPQTQINLIALKYIRM